MAYVRNGDSCIVYSLDMTDDIQLVCGDGTGSITVWSQPDQPATVQSKFDFGNG